MNLAESAPPPQLAPEALPSHEKLQPSEVSITGIVSHGTWGKENETPLDRVRGNEILKNVRRYIEEGYTVVIVEGGNPPKFVQHLMALAAKAPDRVHIVHELPNNDPSPGKGYGNARRQALREAVKLENVRTVFQCEFEKPLHEQLPSLMEAIDNGADIAISDRGIISNGKVTDSPVGNDEKLAGLPPYQARSEAYFNRIVNILLRFYQLRSNEDDDIDFMGNRLFTKDLAWLFLEETTIAADTPLPNADETLFPNIKNLLPPTTPVKYSQKEFNMYSTPLFMPIIEALYLKLKVVSIPTNYNHASNSPKLTAVELVSTQNNKRDSQRDNILLDTITYLYTILFPDLPSPFSTQKPDIHVKEIAPHPTL